MPAPTTTDQLLDQQFLRSIYPTHHEAAQVDGLLRALDELRGKARKDPDLAWLRAYSDGALTRETFSLIMDCPEMAQDYQPLPMRLIRQRWSQLDQRRLRELAGLLAARS